MARSNGVAVKEIEAGEAGLDQPDGLARRLLRWLLRALWAVLVQIYQSPLLRACAARMRDGVLLVLAWAGRQAARASDWLYRRFGKPVTVALSGTAFVWMAFAPDTNPLYRGINWASDADCMAMNIYHEARGEPELGQLAVGHVVMNRVMDPRFPGTVCGVVMQGGSKPSRGCQFSWWCDGRDDRPIDQRSWVDSHQIASLIFAGASKDPTGGALWYHAEYVRPAWRRSLVPGPKIGQHHFYLAPEKR